MKKVELSTIELLRKVQEDCADMQKHLRNAQKANAEMQKANNDILSIVSGFKTK